MGKEEMREIATLIVQTLRHTQAKATTTGNLRAQQTTDLKVQETIRKKVSSLLKQFPLYPELPLE
jgi:glycine/serine hydroxymethyltransferase